MNGKPNFTLGIRRRAPRHERNLHRLTGGRLVRWQDDDRLPSVFGKGTACAFDDDVRPEAEHVQSVERPV